MVDPVQTFKPTGADLDKLQQAAALLKRANANASIAEKEVASAKATIAEWLKTERKLDLATLPIGEIIQIEGACMIEIGKMNKFNEKAFILSDPATHLKFMREIGVMKYKPTI